MDKLTDCAHAFEKLLDIQYRITVGRKGTAVNLSIGFSILDFHHLIGLGKLKDLRIAAKNRGIVFDEILSKKISYETISKSRYIHLIENRFQPLTHIETLLDDNQLVFRYNTRIQNSIFVVPFSQKNRKITQKGKLSIPCYTKKNSV